MSDELKPCPFCGGKAITSAFFDLDDLEYMAFEVNDSESIDGEVTCENERCINGWYLSPKDWNTRPIEDELNRRIAELESIVDKFADAGTELYHRVKAEWSGDAGAKADWRQLMRTYKKDWVI